MHAVQITILFTPLIQATTSLKEAFVSAIATKSASDSLPISQEIESTEPVKKNAKIAGPMCRAAAS